MGAAFWGLRDEKTLKTGRPSTRLLSSPPTCTRKAVEMVNLVSVLPEFFFFKQWFSACVRARCLKGDARSWGRAGLQSADLGVGPNSTAFEPGDLGQMPSYPFLRWKFYESN